MIANNWSSGACAVKQLLSLMPRPVHISLHLHHVILSSVEMILSIKNGGDCNSMTGMKFNIINAKRGHFAVAL